jgi:hypothetical protein
VSARHHTDSRKSLLRVPLVSVTMLVCVAAATLLTGCDRTVTTNSASVPETATPISRLYVVQSHELVEISHFEDGATKYTPTGWIVVSPPATATAINTPGVQ